MLTIPQTISVANLSIPLAINNNAEGALFGNRIANPTSPLTIAMVKSALEWGYDGGQDAEDLRGLANYLYWLCGKYGLQAQRIIGTSSGGGSVVPGTITSTPSAIEFNVDDTTLIPTGGSSVTIPSFIGFNLTFFRNGIVQSTISSEASYYSWNRTTGEFTCSPAATVTELFILSPS